MILRIATVVTFFLAMVSTGWAASNRIVMLDSQYTANDVYLTAQDTDHFYSGGMDVVRINGSRYFLALWNTNPNFPPNTSVPAGNGITLSLYDAAGNLVMDLASYKDPLNEDVPTGNDVIMWAQSVKLSPDQNTIWISYTTSQGSTWNVSDWICTIPWDPTLASYPQAMTPQFEHLGNWEIEWSTDPAAGGQGGELFLSGLISAYHNGIYLYWHNGSSWQSQLVIDIGGSSAGFAFDNKGNLWYGSYWFSNNRLYMWTAAQVDNAVDTGTVLDTGDVTLAIVPPDAELRGDDVEADGAGNVYFSTNRGASLYGGLLRVENNGSAPWPTAATQLSEAKSQLDWQRSLSFDGSGDLAAGQGRLFLDMDQGSQGITTPTFVEIASTTVAAVPVVSPVVFLLVVIAMMALTVFYLKRRFRESVH